MLVHILREAFTLNLGGREFGLCVCPLFHIGLIDSSFSYTLLFFYSLSFIMLLLQESSGPFVRRIVVTSSSAVPEICWAQLTSKETDCLSHNVAACLTQPYHKVCSAPWQKAGFFFVFYYFISGFWGYQSNTKDVFFGGWFWLPFLQYTSLRRCLHYTWVLFEHCQFHNIFFKCLFSFSLFSFKYF